MNEFTTVFSIITDSKYDIIPTDFLFSIMCSFAFIILGIIFLISIIFKLKPNKLLYILLIVFPILIILNTLMVLPKFKKLKSDYNELKNIYYTNNYKIVEGKINLIHEQPKSGHTKGDIIKINNILFEIDSSSSGTFSYGKTISNNGLLQKDVYVKIYYIPYKELSDNLKYLSNLNEGDGHIIRIDIKKK